MKTSFAAISAGVTSLFLFTASCPVRADDSYVPPPMFDDRPAPAQIARPDTDNGNLVPPMVSPQIAPDQPDAATAPPRMRPILEPAPVKKAAVIIPVPPRKPTPPAQFVSIVPEQPATAPPPSTPMPTDAVAAAPPPVPAALPKPAPLTPEADVHQTIPADTTLPPAVAEQPVTAAPAPSVPPPYLPASKVSSTGVVTGPVTMPSVPTQKVEKQDSFVAPDASPDTTIMERTQQQAKLDATSSGTESGEDAAKGDDTLVPVKPADNTKPMEFDSTKQDVLKKILPYHPGEIDLPPDDLKAIGDGIIGELKKRGSHWRVQIRAFATPQGDGVSSDRRIALSRAIALRHALVEAGVRSSRIDVRAEGLQTDSSQTPDRIDLYLYSPIEKVEVF